MVESRITRADLIVVGLGPVGAVAANLAGKAGLRTLVVERGTEPYRLPRAIVFDSEIMRIFASIGLADIIAAMTKPLEGSVYLGADGRPIRTFRAHPRAHRLAWHPSNLFYQPDLEAMLREGIERYPNVEIRAGRSVDAMDLSGALPRLRITGADGESEFVEAPYVFACDGASSTVRKSLSIGLDDIGFEERWLVVDTLVDGEMRWPERYAIPAEVREDRFSLMVCDPARPCTLIPGSGRHRRWEYMLLDSETDEEAAGDPWVRRQIGQWIDPDDLEIVRSAVYRFRALLAERWREGGIFMLGDAAHQTPPFFGQGMCHGIRDAAQLIWRLDLVRRGIAGEALLDSYQPEREPHVREIIAASVAAGSEVCKLDLAEAIARDTRFRAAESARSGQVAMTDVVPPIRAGVLDPASGGMRLPEFVLCDHGVERHVDALLAGRFALLALNPTAEPPEAWRRIGGIELSMSDSGRLEDSDGRLAAWLAERSAEWVIVRPDRYVFASGAGDAALASAFDKLFALLHVAPVPAGDLQRQFHHTEAGLP